ncbi:hypothetical protein [Ferdinandcohnia sp. SAFN-114]|uniref:hypothetical protein n=1 Tax=Ferdinandcohnia sp. SAFN-114 TaxID=3387275 RepID=UPI003F7DAFA5
MVIRDKDFQFSNYTYSFKPKDVVTYELYAETDKELQKIKVAFLSSEKEKDKKR